jgi:hypothetical protein
MRSTRGYVRHKTGYFRIRMQTGTVFTFSGFDVTFKAVQAVRLDLFLDSHIILLP